MNKKNNNNAPFFAGFSAGRRGRCWRRLWWMEAKLCLVRFYCHFVHKWIPMLCNTLWFVNFLFVISDWTRLFFPCKCYRSLHMYFYQHGIFLKKTCAFYLRHSERFFYLNDLRMVTYTGEPNGFGGGSPYWFERMYTFKSKIKVIVFWM